MICILETAPKVGNKGRGRSNHVRDVVAAINYGMGDRGKKQVLIAQLFRRRAVMNSDTDPCTIARNVTVTIGPIRSTLS